MKINEENYCTANLDILWESESKFHRHTLSVNTKVSTFLNRYVTANECWVNFYEPVTKLHSMPNSNQYCLSAKT